MLKRSTTMMLLSLLALGLTGCNQNLKASDSLDWIRGLMIGAFVLGVGSAIVTMRTENADRRVAAGLIAFIAVVLGVLFLFVLIA